MRAAWQSYRGAPEVGAQVCALSDIPEDNTLCLEISGFPLLLVSLGETLRAYVNACPHQYLPLDHKGEKLISADKTILRCTNHSAGFSVETGKGVEGLAIGECLDPVPVYVEQGIVIIGTAG